ncbi:MAG: DUF4386 family protein [Actinobacteria bacterium]|uniref:Unannotated protein n=1 Tax=freshwater metagenome TaxID=449393 RepID=A0A6J6E4T8_9ZZZZ|nr:DUF4386 family protein [Actinomycetota bacterium]
MSTVDSGSVRSSGRLAASISLIQGLLLFVPLVVLGAAIEWPASLDDPAAIALPRLLEEEGAVRFGYIAYLIYSILFVITITLLAKCVSGSAMRAFMSLILGFALISTMARTIGIIRWLDPMPQLAKSWELAATEEERYAISVNFDVLNSYGGTIGEVLGVSIFAAISILLFCIAAIKDRSLPTWLSGFGLIAATAVLATASTLAGVDAGDFLITFGTTMVQLWFLAIGFWLLYWSKKSTEKV